MVSKSRESVKERMEAGEFGIGAGAAEGEILHELDSSNHGEEKLWPLMTPEEEDLIRRLHHLLGDRWELIARRLPDRTAEEVERWWRMEDQKRKVEEDDKIYKPVCARLSPSFKFMFTTDDEISEKRKPSQAGS